MTITIRLTNVAAAKGSLLIVRASRALLCDSLAAFCEAAFRVKCGCTCRSWFLIVSPRLELLLNLLFALSAETCSSRRIWVCDGADGAH